MRSSIINDMTSYVAFLRGIMPANPNMRNEKLRGAFEAMGFQNVRTVISSGNVMFQADSSDAKQVETKIEQALPQQLGFTSTALVRSKNELQALIDRDPFKGVQHSEKTNLNVTFLKSPPQTDLKFPHQPAAKSYVLLELHDREVYSVIDLTGSKTPDLMVWLEKNFSKEITTRTYKTIKRIMDKFTVDEE